MRIGAIFIHSLGLLGLLASSVYAADEPPRKLETLLLLPEPRELRTSLSVEPRGAVKTVLSPAHETVELPGIATYSKDEFKRLGLSLETYLERAKNAADKLLASLKPDLIKDADGKLLYAVFRGDRAVMASLLIAPSLPALFEQTLGSELWVALPDQHSLFVFPAKPEVVSAFTSDLAERYRNDAHAASPEIFALKAGEEPKVVGSFTN